MNIYDALNQGDGSLREPHFTSLLFYLFKHSKEEFPNQSFLDLFITRYAPEFPSTNECEFDLETDIKIEEILFHNNFRRDTDIIVLLRHNGTLKILNIENKINNLAFQNDQISDQHNLLSALYPNSEILNILILPYSIDENINLGNNINIIYWYAENSSLIQIISDYINDITTNNDLLMENLHFLNSCSGLFNKFSYVLEQDRLSNENMLRGPRNILRLSMYEYLSNIAANWETKFLGNTENVTISQLLSVFEEDVRNDLEEDFPNNYNEKLAKFKRGAYEAQPKIMTINEKNRVSFNINNPNDKRLFYYPDSPDGNNLGRWKDRRIKPIRLMNEDIQYLIYWKDNQTNDIRTEIYVPQD
jgi:hypothetical protein